MVHAKIEIDSYPTPWSAVGAINIHENNRTVFPSIATGNEVTVSWKVVEMVTRTKGRSSYHTGRLKGLSQRREQNLMQWACSSGSCSYSAIWRRRCWLAADTLLLVGRILHDNPGRRKLQPPLFLQMHHYHTGRSVQCYPSFADMFASIPWNFAHCGTL